MISQLQTEGRAAGGQPRAVPHSCTMLSPHGCAQPRGGIAPTVGVDVGMQLLGILWGGSTSQEGHSGGRKGV